MEKSSKITLAVIGLAVMVGVGVTSYVVYDNKFGFNDETVSVFSNVPGEAPYSDLLGNAVSLDSHLGKVLVVTTWASWSPFSTADLTMLNKLAESYDPSQVVFMAINRKETKEQATRFIATLPSLNNILMVLDPRDHFYSAVGGYAMPEVLIFNQKGEIVLHDRGVANEANIKAVLDSELGGG